MFSPAMVSRTITRFGIGADLGSQRDDDVGDLVGDTRHRQLAEVADLDVLDRIER